MFIALFGSSTIIQVFQQDNLKADGRNARTLYASFSAERGPILVDGEPIAVSVPVDDEYKYQRVVRERPALLGGHRILHPESGEHRRRGRAQRLSQRHRERPVPGSAERHHHRAEPEGRRGRAHDRPGRAAGGLGRARRPEGRRDRDRSEDRRHPGDGLEALVRPDRPRDPRRRRPSGETYDALLNDPDDPLINRTIAGDLNPPGSTFKLVVTATALENGLTPETEFPNPGTLTLPQSSAVITNAEGGACGGGATVSIATALRLSCNIPFAQLGLQLGYPAISQQAREFGFGDDDIRIPMQVEPSVYPPIASDAELMLSSFGQASDRVSPLQMAMVSAADRQRRSAHEADGGRVDHRARPDRAGELPAGGLQHPDQPADGGDHDPDDGQNVSQRCWQ